MDAVDLLIIGGGINGTAIARDAAGRGLSVMLVEKDDLAAHTSSASSKLVHGGLRYLEQFEFSLVRESLREREILLRTAPHLVRPLRFVLPDPPGGRPFWMIRLGLRLYDLLAGRSSLPRSQSLPPDTPLAAPLRPGLRLAAYWDAAVDDSRLVVANAVAAAEQGANIATRTAFVSARKSKETWETRLSDGRMIASRMLINAAGPWVADLLGQIETPGTSERVRLVKGSHIVVGPLWSGDQAYILQQPDGRVVFAIPWLGHTLIGTTDIPVDGPGEARISDAEIDYLCTAASLYLRRPVRPEAVVHSFAGLRALHDDGARAAKDVTRDYKLVLANGSGPLLLSVFGGKITTARALAEEVMEKLGMGGDGFTAATPLPGGEPDPDFDPWLKGVAAWMPGPLLRRLAAAYGTRLPALLGDARSLEGLGRHFGGGLHAAEVDYLLAHEFARSAEDILWRRTRLGLVLEPHEVKALEDHLGR